jgi:hypothetical protein
MMFDDVRQEQILELTAPLQMAAICSTFVSHPQACSAPIFWFCFVTGVYSIGR